MRIDKFLKVSRLIKRRTVANDACDSERISVNGKPAKASYNVKVDDKITISFGSKSVTVKVLEINEKGKVSLSIKKALPKEEKPRPQKPSKPRRDNNDRGWKGAPQHENSAPMSFEDMMAKFKAQSEDKMSDLKRMSDKRGGNTGYRRGSKQ